MGVSISIGCFLVYLGANYIVGVRNALHLNHEMNYGEIEAS